MRRRHAADFQVVCEASNIDIIMGLPFDMHKLTFKLDATSYNLQSPKLLIRGVCATTPEMTPLLRRP
jgi:hypothetical protein